MALSEAFERSNPKVNLTICRESRISPTEIATEEK